MLEEHWALYAYGQLEFNEKNVDVLDADVVVVLSDESEIISEEKEELDGDEHEDNVPKSLESRSDELPLSSIWSLYVVLVDGLAWSMDEVEPIEDNEWDDEDELEIEEEIWMESLKEKF